MHRPFGVPVVAPWPWSRIGRSPGVTSWRSGPVLAMALLLVSPVAAAAQDAPDTTPAATPAAGDDWPMFKGDAARSGEGADGPVGQPVLRWRYQADGPVNDNVSVVGDLAYASSDDGVLHALDVATGSEKWRFVATRSPVSGPAVVDGVVYVFDGAGTIFALDAGTGQERWHAAAPLDGPSHLTVGGGAVYAGTADGALVALDAMTGAERWRYTVSAAGDAVHSPAFADGIVYVGGDSGGFVAVDASSGELVWHLDTGEYATGTAVVADGIAYVGALSDVATGRLWALDARTGASRWEVDEPLFSPAVSAGVAYSGSDSGLVAAHDTTTGSELWRFQVQGTARPLGVAQGVVYVPADGEHRVYALDAASGSELWHFDVDGGNDCCVAVAHGSVFVGTALGGVYAIGGDGSTVAPSGPPAALPSPVATVPSASVTSSPFAGAAPVEFLWSAAGGAEGMDFPSSVAFDPEGRLWVADTGHGRFAIFTSDGTFVEYWGEPGKGDGQFNLQQSNGNPNGGIAFAPDGSFYILDVGNRRVQHFDRDRQFLGSWGGFGTGPGQYNDAIGIAVDDKGVVHVLDDGRDVVETYDMDGKVLGSFSPHVGRDGANSLALDGQGNIYVSACCDAGNEVRKFDAGGTLLTTIGSSGTGPGRYEDQPTGMAIDAAGRLFVTQGPTGSDDRVLMFDADGSFLASFGSPGSGPGQIGFAWGVALDGQGNVYVADAGAVVDAGPNEVHKFRLLPPFVPAP